MTLMPPWLALCLSLSPLAPMAQPADMAVPGSTADWPAIADLSEALVDSERRLGWEHPDTLYRRATLARSLLGERDIAGAEQLLMRNARARANVFSPADLRGLLGGRALLLAGQAEPEGYGLYSYLLFESPPRDAEERERCLKAIEAHLMLLPAIAELERYQRRSRLNLTLLPVKESLDLPDDAGSGIADAAQRVLRVYDHARAKVLLARLGHGDAGGGPFIVSRLPGSDQAPQRLFFDLRNVAPALVWDWTRSHGWLAAEERGWSEAALQQFALQLRNVIAVAARQGAALVDAAPQAQRVEVGARR